MKYKSTADITIDYLNDLIAENQFCDITIQDPKNYPKGKTYDLFAMLAIKKAMENFLRGCPRRNANDPDTEKDIFAYIYIKLAYWANYDYLAREINSSKSKIKNLYAGDFLNDVSGLEGIMVSKSGVCSGFAETLRNLLAEQGIEAKYISGYTKRDENGDRVGHAWNQVKLDGRWFNCDITTDRSFITQDLIAPMFLKSNYEFSNYLKFSSDISTKIEAATKSLSNQSQEILIRRHKSKIVEELFPKDDGRISKKNGFIRKLSERLSEMRRSQRGEE